MDPGVLGTPKPWKSVSASDFMQSCRSQMAYYRPLPDGK